MTSDLVKRRLPPRRAWVLSLVVLSLAAALPGQARPAVHRPLQTAFTDARIENADLNLAFSRMRAAGASAVGIYVIWSSIAPPGSSKPAGFDPTNPADPHYNWADLDARVRAAVANGLSPILVVSRAPTWAENGTAETQFVEGGVRPSPQEFGAFMLALATRYGGNFGGLPRVRHWQAWVEPNLSFHLFPAFDTPYSQPVTRASHPVSPDLYAGLLSAFSNAVHAVHGDNVVIAGGLAPFARFGPFDHGVAPLVFMRQLLCLTARNRPLAGCARQSQFEIWGQDPYTGGGPQHRALVPGNVSIGNLGEVRQTLQAAVRAHRIASRGGLRFWVMEFGWNTKPPFSQGVPVRLHARWVSEALYRMWLDGVSLVTWFQLRDDQTYQTGTTYQAGLYFNCPAGLACDRPKPSLTAFRFPFVAFRAGARVLVWGRTPTSRPGRVRIEQRRGARWVALGALRADRFGVFTSRLRPRGGGDLRAVFAGARSLGFSLRRPPDRVINPPL
jgi:hypothetical protein